MHLVKERAHRVLSDAEKEQFVRDGFVKFENAFSSEIAAEARAILWRAVDCDPDDTKTWTRPVIRLGDFAQDPFRQAVNTTSLHAAFDELVGVGRWIPRQSLGGFPIRFPHPDDPGDTGWHVDASFPPGQPIEPPGSYFDWRINLRSKGRALLMLFLFSDVSENDAPTRIRVGSHLRIPQLLAPGGEDERPSMKAGTIKCSRAVQPKGCRKANREAGTAGTVFLLSSHSWCTLHSLIVV